MAVYLKLITEGSTANIVTLPVNTPARPILIGRCPSYDITTVSQTGNHRCLLAIFSISVNQKLLLIRN